jgi:hypothetical protein
VLKCAHDGVMREGGWRRLGACKRSPTAAPQCSTTAEHSRAAAVSLRLCRRHHRDSRDQASGRGYRSNLSHTATVDTRVWCVQPFGKFMLGLCVRPHARARGQRRAGMAAVSEGGSWWVAGLLNPTP